MSQLATLNFTDPVFKGVPLHDQQELSLWLQKNPERAEELFAYLAKQNALPALRDSESQLHATSALERIQFDGDVPEVRVGPLPKGATPAVPVHTTSLNPIVVGVQLQDASLSTAKMLAQETPLDASTDLALYEPAHYRTGQLAQPLQGTPVDLLALSQEDAHKAYWRALSTTQGRNSVCLPIYNEVKRLLEEDGVEVVEATKKGNTLESFIWKINLSGLKDQNITFNPLRTAAQSIAIMLRPAALNYAHPVQFEITAYHDIANRKVGWIGELFAAGDYQ